MDTLILEREYLVAELMASILGHNQCEIAHDVDEAERLVAQHGIPRLLITDRRVEWRGDWDWRRNPSLDGEAFAARLTSDRPELPVVFTTTTDAVGLAARKHQAVVLKPFLDTELLNAVTSAIAG